MRASWFSLLGFMGLGLVAVRCGDSSSSDGLFVPPATSQTATGSGGSGTTGSAGSSGKSGSDSSGSSTVTVGAGGTGAGGQSSGAGGTGGSGPGATTTGGGKGGSAGSAAGSGGTGGPAGAGGTGGAVGTGGARPDAGVDGGIADAGADGGPLHPIHCGAVSCAAPTQFCCIPTNANQLPRCVPTGGACPGAADRLSCDDRTDCPDIGQICCAELGANGTVAACTPPINCNAQFQGQELCDPTRAGSCLMLGMNQCQLDNQAIIAGYAYCH